MAHFAKYTRGSCGGLTKHYERAKDKDGNYYRFKNEEIDPTRTHLNYNLAPHNEKQLEFIKERLSEVYCLKRDDVKVMCSWVLTAPKELPEEHQREFFERSYKFLADRYGEKNVISAYVHMDETSPHMHFAFIPVVHDLKKDREKVSAKEVMTKVEMNSFHTDLQEVMNEFVAEHDYEFECNVLNGATDNGNLTVQGLKAKELEAKNEVAEELFEEAAAELSEAQAKLETVNETIYETNNDLRSLKAEKQSLEGEIKRLEGKCDELKDLQEEIAGKDLLGRPREHVKLSYEEYAKLQYRARRIDSIEEKQEEVESLLKQAEQKETTANEHLMLAETHLDHARDKHKKASEKLKEAEKAYETAKAVIIRMAKKAVKDFIDKAFKGHGNAVIKRMSEFMDKIPFPNGKTALEVFKEQESFLERQVRESFEKYDWEQEVSNPFEGKSFKSLGNDEFER